MLAWIGLERYNFEEEAQRLAYRWCHTLTKAFVYVLVVLVGFFFLQFLVPVTTMVL